MTGAPGDVVDYRGQRYQLLCVKPWTRRDGGTSSIAIWRSTCPQCGEVFECATQAVVARFKPARRCPDCRRETGWRRRLDHGRPPPAPGERPFAPLDAYDEQR